ncbi:MAG TPA: hypothetical protein PKG82_08050 [Myxococcota bacterium]|nr:hypothetical protein [Myxococcota bacterium]
MVHRSLANIFIIAALFAFGCGGGPTPQSDVVQDTTEADTVSDTALPDIDQADVPSDDSNSDIPSDIALPDGLERPVADPVAAARAFRLYYAERVDRAVVAFNRFMLFGDTMFGINIRKVGVARSGDTFEVVPGPKDNNQIGTSVRAAWNAYRLYRTRTLELALIRMFNGMEFIGTVSGHDGVTGRNAYPNWTMTINGPAGTVGRTRDGTTVESPYVSDAGLESEMISTFFGDMDVTYRLEPADILFNYMPAVETGSYAVTYSFSMLPDFLRISDCCTSMMKVPDDYPWAGAFWSNHNSRDNFPDLVFGYLAAGEAMDDPDAGPELKAAATAAWEAGRKVGDLVQQNDSRIMTVSEHTTYDQLTVSGEMRPDGTVEAETLGAMSDCQMNYAARALSTDGLDAQLPELPLPGALENLIAPFVDVESGCEWIEGGHTCTRLAESFCGKTWGQLNELTMGGKGLIDLAMDLDEEDPGAAGAILGQFYGNYDQPMNAALAVVEYARLTGKQDLLELAQATLAEMTDLSRTFADVIFGRADPAEQAQMRYETALIDGLGGLTPPATDFLDFAVAEQQMAAMEGLLEMPDSTVAALLTELEIAEQIDDEQSDASAPVKKRYRDNWGDIPPVRVEGEGYQAKVFERDTASDWRPVERPHHRRMGGIDLLEALPLCVTNPQVLDCTWAKAGCARPDLNHDGKVDDADRTIFQTTAQGTTGCLPANNYCDGADLDHTGTVDALDTAFMDAAQGCHYFLSSQPSDNAR